MTQYVRIYRVEHPTSGHGPYRHRSIRCRTNLFHPDNIDLLQHVVTDRCPTPREEGIRVPRLWRHGFKTKRQLNRWFGVILGDLKDMGYVVHTYKVPKDQILIAKRQCVFNPKVATRIE